MTTPTLNSIAEKIRKAETAGEKFESSRSIVSQAAIAELRTTYPGIPEDYLEYLRHIGSGSILSCSYAVYEAPIAPIKIFGLHHSSWPSDLLAFGDNFSGGLGVFIPSEGWAVAELWHYDRSIVRYDDSFSDYLSGLIENLAQDP